MFTGRAVETRKYARLQNGVGLDVLKLRFTKCVLTCRFAKQRVKRQVSLHIYEITGVSAVEHDCLETTGVKGVKQRVYKTTG